MFTRTRYATCRYDMDYRYAHGWRLLPRYFFCSLRRVDIDADAAAAMLAASLITPRRFLLLLPPPFSFLSPFSLFHLQVLRATTLHIEC